MPVSTPSDPQAAALLAHVLSQTQANINFLASQNYITSSEASELIDRLSQGPAAVHAPSPDVAASISNLSLGPVRSSEPARRVVPPPPPRNRTTQARALWAYNEDGRDANDLSFSQGETIEIIDETNADWWTGRCRGKQGLFPSNHVEKLAGGAPTSVSPPPMHSMPPAPSYYSPPAAPMYNVPPPHNEKAGYYGAPVQAPPPPQSVVVQQAAPAEAPKKSRFGNLGNTMANSAAGGVGFGAGAAIGSGIVNAIF